MKYNNAETLQSLLIKVSGALQKYIVNSQDGQGKVLDQMPASQLSRELNIDDLVKHGGIHKEPHTLKFLHAYLAHSQHMHHPQYIGHQVAVPHIGSGVSDLIHGIINNPMAIYEMGPSAAVIEKSMIHWLLKQVGWYHLDDIADMGFYPQHGAGVFTHGGSMANLTALLAARAAIAPESWTVGSPDDLVIIGSSVWHYSISRAMSIMGMPQDTFYRADVDENDVLTLKGIERAIARAHKDGKRIMAVIVNACTTSTGLYDPIQEIATICQREQLWLHIDGAHGAAALLSETDQHLMSGVEMADSIIWDMHKMLRTSTLCAAVLYKNPEHMAATFQQKGSYIFHEKEAVGFDVIPYTLECTKAALATKLFWVLAIEGEQGLADYVSHQYAITKKFYELIIAAEDFDCPYVPESNILCFTYSKIPLGLDAGIYHLQLRNELVSEGYYYITSCDFRGTTHLRITVMNDLTTEQHMTGLLDAIRITASRLISTTTEL